VQRTFYRQREVSLPFWNGVEVTYRINEDKNTLVTLTDFVHPESNEFLMANQYAVIEGNIKHLDLIVFANGLPLVVIELKKHSRRARFH
jgi:type I restriction enzyme R subunit